MASQEKKASGAPAYALYAPPSALGPGEMLLRAEDGALTGVFFVDQKYAPAIGQRQVPVGSGVHEKDGGVLAAAAGQLDAWFAGELASFDLPLALHGSELKRRVWQHLAMIPYGERVTYGSLARALGLPPGHARAVGSAVGRNPLAIVLPCHRVVAADGSLRGYAGGLERKAWLLAHERACAEGSGTQ